MDHTALPQNNDGPTLEQKRQIALGWPEFFQQLGLASKDEDPRRHPRELIEEELGFGGNVGSEQVTSQFRQRPRSLPDER